MCPEKSRRLSAAGGTDELQLGYSGTWVHVLPMQLREEWVHLWQRGGEAEVLGSQLALLSAKAMPLNISACFSWGV